MQLALPAEVLDPDLLDLVGGGGRIDSCEAGVLECLGVHGSAEVTEPPVPCNSLQRGAGGELAKANRRK